MAWKRSSAASRGYGPAWEALRREVLAEEPLCRGCGSLSTEVDHVVAKAFGGTDARGNLEGLCAGCHRQKTVKERHGVVLSFGASPRLFVDVDGTLVGCGVREGVGAGESRRAARCVVEAWCGVCAGAGCAFAARVGMGGACEGERAAGGGLVVH